MLDAPTGDGEFAPPLPTDWERADAPLVSGEADTHDQAGYASPFHAGRHVADPLGEWYLYWSGHDGGGIRLHVADDLLGPWEDAGVLFDAEEMGVGDHLASPSAVWDPHRERLNLYYHRGYNPPGGYRQDTALAVSTDGRTYDRVGPVVTAPMDGSWDARERSYMRVVRAGGAFVGVYQGRDRGGNNPGVGYAWSADGVDWETLSHPLFYNRHVEGYDPRTFQHGSPSLASFGGQAYVVEAYDGADADGREIHAVRFEGPDAGPGGRTRLLGPTADWEGGNLEAPVVRVHDGRAHLFYNSVEMGSMRRQIGVAHADLEGERCD